MIAAGRGPKRKYKKCLHRAILNNRPAQLAFIATTIFSKDNVTIGSEFGRTFQSPARKALRAHFNVYPAKPPNSVNAPRRSAKCIAITWGIL